MNGGATVVGRWDPDVLAANGETGGLDAPWVSSIGSHTLGGSWGNGTIADQLAGKVVPHQFNSLVRIVLEDHWDSGVRVLRSDRSREVLKSEAGDGVSAHDGGSDVGSGISVTSEVGNTFRRIAVKFGVEVEESKLLHLLEFFLKN